jgi:hypothetical protein
VPFAAPEEALGYLESRREAGALTLFDDGEKFGVWPGTHHLAYEERWLPRFFEALVAAPWLRMSTFSAYLDAAPPEGSVYLPTASYTEMGEWALPAAAAQELEETRRRLEALPDGARMARLLRGGFWRNFLVKYPEMGDAYATMLAVSRRLREALRARPDDPRLQAAREDLWRGQANDAYWHGVFGGCYLPHLRRAVKSALVAAERILDEAGPRSAVEWAREDIDGDGREEIRARTRELTVTLRPEAGGTMSELAFRPLDLDVAGVFTRRPEAYHGLVKDRLGVADITGTKTIHSAPTVKEDGLQKLLDYDPWRRASLLDGFFPPGDPPDPLNPWAGARLALGERLFHARVSASAVGLEASLHLDAPDGWPLRVEKRVSISSEQAEVRAEYRLHWHGDDPVEGRWAVQLNLTLTAGEAEGRYYRVEGRPSLGSRGALGGARTLTLVDEWIGGEIGIGWSAGAHIGWAPIETVSLSESGFERIYQGSALLLTWPVTLAPGGVWEGSVSLVPRVLPRGAGRRP